MSEETEKEVKKVKNLSKGFEGDVLVMAEAITGTELRFDINDLPETIKANLMKHGMSQKLGDAAAGKSGQEAIDSINKVWDGLSKGDWSVRAPAAAKVDKKAVLAKFAAMDSSAKELLASNPETKDLLEKLGVKF